jgi:hypothetical protein
MWALITSPRRKSSPKQPNAAAAWTLFAFREDRRQKRHVMGRRNRPSRSRALPEVLDPR